MIAALLDHLWQSTLFAGGIALLTLLLRRNGAGVRFWLWFTASLKFLMPFSALVVVGEHLSRLFPAALPRTILAIQPAAEKLSAPAQMLVARHQDNINLTPLLLGLWLAGFGAMLALRLLRWSRLRALLAGARDLPLPAPVGEKVRVKASSSLMEPGLVGIFSPVVLLPAGLMARLSGAERDSILAHELCHLRRGDNITAAIHMAVEGLFWFYPPVWLIGARLIAERERACDESVLASGHDAETYAGGILKVCKFCIQSPLACAPGASGADLGNRVRQIMTGEAALRLGRGKQLLLTGAAALALALPVMGGFLTSPLAVNVQKSVAAVRSQVAASFTRNVAVVEEGIGLAPRPHVQVRRLPRLKVAVAAAPLPLPQPMPSVDPAPAQAAAPQVEPALPAPAPAAEVQRVSTPAPSLKDAVVALDPRGAGDPDAITCRAPQQLPGSRFVGPEVCKANWLWAELRARHEEISADGLQVIALDASQAFKKSSSGSCPLGPRVTGGTVALLSLPRDFCF